MHRPQASTAYNPFPECDRFMPNAWQRERKELEREQELRGRVAQSIRGNGDRPRNDVSGRGDIGGRDVGRNHRGETDRTDRAGAGNERDRGGNDRGNDRTMSRGGNNNDRKSDEKKRR